MNAEQLRELELRVMPHDALAPITHDAELDRTTIPLPGGWSAHRYDKSKWISISEPTGVRHDFVNHEMLERMARDIHAAVSAQQVPENHRWDNDPKERQWFEYRRLDSANRIVATIRSEGLRSEWSYGAHRYLSQNDAVAACEKDFPEVLAAAPPNKDQT